MKQSEQSQFDLEQCTNQQVFKSQIIHPAQTHDNTISQAIYDEEALRIHIKQKYRRHLRKIRNSQSNSNTIANFIKCLIYVLYDVLEQMWIQVVPQFIRGRCFAEKNRQIMNKHQKLNCGNLNLFFNRMKKQGKRFAIIFQQKPKQKQQCLQMDQNLFDGSYESDQKLNEFLNWYQVISLNNKDIENYVKNQDNTINLLNLQHSYSKFPALVACRFNFMQEFCIMGSFQTAQLSERNFRDLQYQLSSYTREIIEIEGQCKRSVLAQILNAQM